MYTLYGTTGSGSAAIEVALQRCGVAFKMVRASEWEPDSALTELARLNPLKQIPTLVLPDGTVMSESAAILIHLGLAFPHSGLLPLHESRRAVALRGLVFISANCYSAVSVSDYPQRWSTDDSASALASIRTAARANLHRAWDVFADTFPASPFLSGDAMGALDILAVTVSRWSGTRAHLAKSRPGFLATLLTIERHPDVAQVFARHWAP
jgi:GST-like protein